jgi:hypothetical protein
LLILISLAEELGVQVEDERDALRTLKRRQQANVKVSLFLQIEYFINAPLL